MRYVYGNGSDQLVALAAGRQASPTDVPPKSVARLQHHDQ
ncbi:hypothetical protein SUDANB130_04452 [Streptomyces sp. enrichment culture]